MTKYDFDRLTDRTGTLSYKWDQSKKLFGREDVLPLWVADMDFEPPREVVQAIKQRAEQGVYGYTIRPQAWYDAVVGWQARRHNWQIRQEWVTSSPGVVAALSLIVYTFTQPGDGIILQSPVYYPFYEVIRRHGRTVVDNPLQLIDGRYEIDFDLLERQAADGAKLLLLCSPHNPGGRVWTREELARMGDICKRHGVLIVSDEIHQDLVFSGSKHVPLASISEELADITFTCVATSKTFNLAGLQTSCVIIPNERLRSRYDDALKTFSLHMETYFGVTSVISAYTYGDEWLDQLLVYLQDNRDFLIAYLKEHLPEVAVMRPEATYLAWIDCRAISEEPAELKRLMYEEAGVAFNEGSMFGKAGRGFLRVNFACPRSRLTEALERFANASALRLGR